LPSNRTDTTVLADIERLFTQRGKSMYAGEPVTQTEHALQSAWLAEQHGANPAMISAALLHDVGHLLHEFDEDCAQQGIDDQHEQVGARWLGARFGPEVCQPVVLHVTAKRYRCAIDENYRSRLSSASQLSLHLQGGPLADEDANRFRQHPYFREALQLRQWDEAAKVPGLQTPPLSYFLDFVEQALKDSQ
jgi:phosphonate degradation associated HDIG domain protein